MGVFSRADFLLKLQEKLGKCFDALDSLGNLSILGSELWEEHFDSLLRKDYIANIWEAWKINYYGDDSSKFSTGDLGDLIYWD